MIKDKLVKAVQTGLDNIRKGDDHIPLGMRGELEVIVKDREGNVLSYEKDHNQVTKLAKMAIIHLLAGEIGTIDSQLLSYEKQAGRRAYTIEGSSLNPPSDFAYVVPRFTVDNHTLAPSSLNADGQLVSGEQFFYDGSQIIRDNGTSVLSQVSPFEGGDVNTPLSFNYPTKMLFGTGLEAYNDTSLDAAYANVYLSDTQTSSISLKTIARLNGYSTNEASAATFNTAVFFKNLNEGENLEKNTVLSNWYSANAYRCRTLQPATTEPLSDKPTSSDTAIKGAIKNCYITSPDDYGKYNSSTKMALPQYRGYGYPCFIYAKRSTAKFYDTTDKNEEVYYQKNDIFDAEPYETELTYTVKMPAQPVNSNDISTFYPYNGWIIKQAGLFCDSRYMLRSKMDDPDLGEQAFIDAIADGDVLQSDSAKSYRDSVGGQLLFTRNLSSPIMKTADTEVFFIWHIFITV